MKKKTENVKGAPFSKSVIPKKRKKKSSCREAKEERIEEEKIVLAGRGELAEAAKKKEQH